MLQKCKIFFQTTAARTTRKTALILCERFVILYAEIFVLKLAEKEQIMKRSVKITLITLGAILCAILIVVAGCAIFANSKNDDTQPTAELKSWMSYIGDDVLLKNVVIPGAHDAGTAGISYLAETQDRNIAELLDCGTRYLDLRVAKAGDQLKIYHGPFKGVELNEVMVAIQNFLYWNPTEMLILDFQHFDGDAEQQTLETVQQYLGFWLDMVDGEKVIFNDTDKTDVKFMDGLTLGQCRGKCLIVWGGSKADEYSTDMNYVFKRNNDEGTRKNSVLHSYYDSALNKKSSANYVENALTHYIDMYKKQNNGLFVLQGQLTDGMLVFGPRFREAQHTDNMDKYVESLYESGDLIYINIVMRDFVSPHKNAMTLKLNVVKGIVKPDCVETYNKMIEDNL